MRCNKISHKFTFTAEQPKPRRRQRVTLPEALPEDDDSSWAAAPVTNMVAPKTNDSDDNDDDEHKVSTNQSHQSINQFIDGQSINQPISQSASQYLTDWLTDSINQFYKLQIWGTGCL